MISTASIWEPPSDTKASNTLKSTWDEKETRHNKGRNGQDYYRGGRILFIWNVFFSLVNCVFICRSLVCLGLGPVIPHEIVCMMLCNLTWKHLSHFRAVILSVIKLGELSSQSYCTQSCSQIIISAYRFIMETNWGQNFVEQNNCWPDKTACTFFFPFWVQIIVTYITCFHMSATQIIHKLKYYKSFMFCFFIGCRVHSQIVNRKIFYSFSFITAAMNRGELMIHKT